MTTDERLDRYARLAVEFGVNLAHGQDLLVDAHIAHAPLVRRIARAAYVVGAHHVDAVYFDTHVTRALIELGDEESLDWTPAWIVQRLDDATRRRSARLTVYGDPEPDLMADLDGERVGKARQSAFGAALVRVANSGEVNRCVISAPNQGWAREVLGEPDVERLWQLVEWAVRLDQPDPVAAWREHLDRLRERAAATNDRHFDAIRFRGPGTDLTVGLLPSSVWWCAGRDATTWGRSYVPNMPTEEIFTTPDPRRTEGTVRSTRPLTIGSTTVRDLSLRFETGRVTYLEASCGEDAMRAMIATDDGAAFLGEVALVDGQSRVGELGLVMHNALFDENAASHIALGQGYAVGIDGGRDRDAADLRALGVNASSEHADIMVGGRDVEVDGLGRGGPPIPLLRGGQWQLE
jgi:aminopeptidase